jgi:hypothetical protein
MLCSRLRDTYPALGRVAGYPGGTSPPRMALHRVGDLLGEIASSTPDSCSEARHSGRTCLSMMTCAAA